MSVLWAHEFTVQKRMNRSRLLWEWADSCEPDEFIIIIVLDEGRDLGEERGTFEAIIRRPLSSMNGAAAMRPSTIYLLATAVKSHRASTRYDTRCYFNVRSKADISQLNLPHGTNN